MYKLYDQADIYDLFESEKKYLATKKHWETVFLNKKIRSVLDVSIGTGASTIPLLDLGVDVFGSDLNPSMLSKCLDKANERGYRIDLRCSDFRNIKDVFDRKFDCVMSTGNSLPHVMNEDVLDVLEQMDHLIEDGGYLFLDLRNWDKILQEKNRFYLYNPSFVGENRIDLVQVWDYNIDGSMTFNLLYRFEKDNKIFQKEFFEERYYPIRQDLILEKLKALGYNDIRIMAHPAYFGDFDHERSDWYCLIAQKS